MVEYVREDKGISSYGDAVVATHGCAARYMRAYDRLVMEVSPARDPLVQHEAIWYYGEGRVGKSHLAFSENPGAYSKMLGTPGGPTTRVKQRS